MIIIVAADELPSVSGETAHSLSVAIGDWQVFLGSSGLAASPMVAIEVAQPLSCSH